MCTCPYIGPGKGHLNLGDIPIRIHNCSRFSVDALCFCIWFCLTFQFLDYTRSVDRLLCRWHRLPRVHAETENVLLLENSDLAYVRVQFTVPLKDYHEQMTLFQYRYTHAGIKEDIKETLKFTYQTDELIWWLWLCLDFKNLCIHSSA